MVNTSSEFILRQVRIVLFWLSGLLVGKGVMDGSTAEWMAGGALQAIAWAWSLWGNRIVARVNELVKIPNFIVIAPPEIAEEVKSSSAVSTQEVKVTAAPMLAGSIAANNPEVKVETGRP